MIGAKRARAEVWVLFACLLAHALVGLLPLFERPGYESALALGLIAPTPLAAVCGWRAAHSARGSGLRGAMGELGSVLVRGVWLALALVSSALGISLLHALRSGLCDSLRGTGVFLLGPGVGCLMAAAWGGSAGLVAAAVGRGGPWGALLGAAGPLMTIAISLGRFYTSPMIFAFDPFFGYFAGTLYDTVIVATPRLTTYRVGSISTLTALACLASLLRRGSAAGGSAPPSRSAVSLTTVVGAACLGGSLAVWWWGDVLGHHQSRASIVAALGHIVSSDRCTVVHSGAVSDRRARLMARECEEYLYSHEAFFEVQLAGRVTVYAFGSPEEKGRLMGASQTYIAKPWRHEVYVQTGRYPHRVLGHELAHVVAGAMGRGPFAVAGPLGGWIPDPGRIEGFAVAAAPAEDTERDLMQWSRALLELDLFPDLTSLFRLSFLGQNSSKAYTVAGAFVRWLRDHRGPAALRRWYGGEPLAEATGAPLGELEAQFRQELARQPVSPEELAAAQARFQRPAIFGRRCPHVVDRVLTEAREALATRAVAQSARLFRQAGELDAQSLTAKLGFVACQVRAGQPAAARESLVALARDPTLLGPERAMVLERLGDRFLVEGQLEQALPAYEQALAYATDEPRSRTLEVKLLAAGGIGTRELTDYLIGDGVMGVHSVSAGAALGRWSQREPGVGHAAYLGARSLLAAERYGEADATLSRALSRDLLLPSVRREARRLSLVVACAQGLSGEVVRRLRAYVAEPGGSWARKQGMQRLAARCALGVAVPGAQAARP